MRIGAGGEFGFETFVGFAVVESGDADAGFRHRASASVTSLLLHLSAARFQLHQHLRQIAVAGRSADQ